jgi:hypothetical protein
MKIINQTADEMALKDGNVGGLISGIIAIVGSLGIGGYAYFTYGWSNGLWIAVAFFVVGLFVLFSSATTAVDISKSNDKINYQRKRLIGGSQATYAISDVLRIETRKQWRTETTGTNNNRQTRQVLVSQSVIVFKNGTELPLDSGSGGSTSVGVGGVMMGGSGKEIAIATQVANFIGVPFQEIAPPNSGMGTGVNIGGIQL